MLLLSEKTAVRLIGIQFQSETEDTCMIQDTYIRLVRTRFPLTHYLAILTCAAIWEMNFDQYKLGLRQRSHGLRFEPGTAESLKHKAMLSVEGSQPFRIQSATHTSAGRGPSLLVS